MKNLYHIGFLLIISIMMSCNQDEDVLIDIEETEPDHVVLVDASFQGIVMDSDGLSLADVTIILGDSEVTTGNDGQYAVEGKANAKGAYLKVVKEGYFDAYANLSPSVLPKQVNFTLLEKTIVGSFNSTSTGNIEGIGYSIDFSPNSIKDAITDAAYNGEVTVYAAYIDPTDRNINAVPGDLLATDKDDNSVILSSYGMVHVELEGESGQALQLSSDAELSIEVPSAKLSSASSEIPLWYFDTDTGLWSEEGEAQLTNGVYKGMVSHFSLWNVDLDYDFHELSGSVIYNGSAATNVYVLLEWVEENESRITFLDAEGGFSGKVPQGATIIAKVIDYCDNLTIGQDLGVVTSDMDVTLDLALEPCDTEDAYQVSFAFNGQILKTIEGVELVTIANPADSIYRYHFEFTDTSQSVDVAYKWYVWEYPTPGEWSFVHELTYGGNDNVDAYVVTGSFTEADIEETAEYVSITAENIRFEVQESATNNFVWYNGDISIRAKK